MSTFIPFKALRPIPEKAKDIASPPYDVMDSDEARIEVRKHPLSFIHVEKPEVDLPIGTDLYDPKVYAKAKENLDKYRTDGHMIQDEKPMFYIYRQTMDDREQYGLVGLASVDEYMDGTIKKHEHTRADKEADRIRHVDTCNAHPSPVFFTYPHQDAIDKVVDKVRKNSDPVYDFVSDDGIGHTLWLMDDEKDIASIQASFAKLPYLYVADGHHRTASAAKVGLLRREQFPDFTGEEEFNHFMTVIFPDNQLKIFDYNRVVKDLNGNSTQEFMDKVRKDWLVEEIPAGDSYRPSRLHQVSMYIDGKWYFISPKPGTWNEADVVENLDVSILQNNLLHPILGIGDPRTDMRIDFVGGIRGLKELIKRVDSGREKVAFAMHPTSMDELIGIADAGKIMPPKSTWFEPKLRSGLFIHLLD
ncbi:MAG: DUF1015 family protein [Candidatus Cloacimonadaceae bacterium]|jgi:uncharacterized protein (DUF1015 family)|nr:DUF1015 family protein [Candidatus Cloacimonadota bacterium]MDY0127278.1 DUF1015 family protein [Candidatus Cloacimonadaceae bacterium]MCB5255206.1 DUF1015 family protein [Candidatus Cloacimonadota bacterium]MCK9177835.1 DUF1015 family protein [Candidatus Cloacimonadota bacterium]MCK9242181.1 DUF1015 family protein [Candidatus Cloacimonadota bacterium]